MIYFLFTTFIISINAIQSIKYVPPICFDFSLSTYDIQSNTTFEHRYCSITKHDRDFECITCNITTTSYQFQSDCKPKYECLNLNFKNLATFENLFSTPINRRTLANIIHNKFNHGVDININIGHYFFVNITPQYIHGTVDIPAPRTVVTLTFDNSTSAGVAHVDIKDKIDSLNIHALIIIIKCKQMTFPSEAKYEFTKDNSNKISQQRTNSCTPIQSTTSVSSPKFYFIDNSLMSVIDKINVRIGQ